MLCKRFLPHTESCRTLHFKPILFTHLYLASFCATNSCPTSLVGLHGPVSHGNLTSLGESGLMASPGLSHSHSGLLRRGFILDNVMNSHQGCWMEEKKMTQQNNGKL